MLIAERLEHNWWHPGRIIHTAIVCGAPVLLIGKRRFALALVSLRRLHHDPHRFRRWEVWRRRSRRLRSALTICEPSFWVPPILAVLAVRQILAIRATVMLAIVTRVTPFVDGLLAMLVRMSMMSTVVTRTAIM